MFLMVNNTIEESNDVRILYRIENENTRDISYKILLSFFEMNIIRNHIVNLFFLLLLSSNPDFSFVQLCAYNISFFQKFI